MLVTVTFVFKEYLTFVLTFWWGQLDKK